MDKRAPLFLLVLLAAVLVGCEDMGPTSPPAAVSNPVYSANFLPFYLVMFEFPLIIVLPIVMSIVFPRKYSALFCFLIEAVTGYFIQPSYGGAIYSNSIATGIPYYLYVLMFSCLLALCAVSVSILIEMAGAKPLLENFYSSDSQTSMTRKLLKVIVGFFGLVGVMFSSLIILLLILFGIVLFGLSSYILPWLDYLSPSAASLVNGVPVFSFQFFAVTALSLLPIILAALVWAVPGLKRNEPKGLSLLETVFAAVFLLTVISLAFPFSTF